MRREEALRGRASARPFFVLRSELRRLTCLLDSDARCQDMPRSRLRMRGKEWVRIGRSRLVHTGRSCLVHTRAVNAKCSWVAVTV